MRLDTNTYDQYLSMIADSSPMNLQEGSQLIVDRFQHLQNIPLHFVPVPYFVDYTTQKYIYADGTGIHSIDDQVTGSWQQVYDSDQKVINEKVLPLNFKFLETITPEEYPDFIFSHNYRLQNASGECVIMVQRYSYIPGPTAGKPAGVIGIVFNITHFKNDLSIVHTIEKTTQENNGLSNHLIYKETYPVYDMALPQSLSKRELMVLKLMAEGLGSQQIATRLQLSLNTINNHRKNMLHKTDCKSSAELLNHAIQHGLLSLMQK